MNCPHCQRLLYNRKLKNCGFCGAELPPECLFSAAELAEIDTEMDAIEQQFRQAQSAENITERREETGQTHQVKYFSSGVD